MKRARQIVTNTLNRHSSFLHRFEQRRLCLWRCTIDLVSEDDVGEDRTRMNCIARWPVARSSSMISVPVMSAGIRSGVNWIPLKREIENTGDSFDEQGFCQARDAGND